MNELRKVSGLPILHSLRLQAQPGEIVQVNDPDTRLPVAAIRHGGEDAFCTGIWNPELGDWLAVAHEKGSLGLPLTGMNRRSWQSEWENDRVYIEVCTSEGWKELAEEHWDQISLALKASADSRP